MSIAVIFSGQGLQAQAHIDELLAWATETDQLSVLQTQLPELFTRADEPLDAWFYDNLVAQPFLLALQYSRWQYLTAQGVTADYLLGYSLGELTAFCISIGLELSTAMTLARTRASLMSAACADSAGLVSVQGVHHSELLPILAQTDTHLSIALSAVGHIVGGRQDDLAQLVWQLGELGYRQLKYLNVSIPSHTPLMHVAMLPFQDALIPYQTHRLALPIISGTRGRIAYQAADAARHLTHQIDHHIDWHTTMQMLAEYQPSVVLEIGAGGALSKLAGEQLPNAKVRSVDDFGHIDDVLMWLA
ncbi:MULTISPECIES: ACP S-malonyltransferase [Moraxella]|uniref:Malonyl-CoA:ACP transacylase (MAT) domain-containing protein n=1 Tax=Moraxella catarrhalis TaxID=480 RepID=A0A7Z1A4F0_MORCA|nr:ACP S-malonyltransferase [Moraxella catarrhalis]OAV01596.1 hypothetical protein AO382_0643 [Moraxella catarrhalis]STY82671.1 Polyketide biosynthesis malonyl CoA-acyl carrier protein transacylase BaeC [Moraxella catarrhalis]